MENAVIQTKRCRLDRATADDVDIFTALAGDARVRQFLGGPVDTVAASRRFSELLASPATEIWVSRLLGDGSTVGVVSVGPHHDGVDIEISYELKPEHWGKGLASELVAAVVDTTLRSRPDLSRLIAETQVANAVSRALLARTGFIDVGRVERFGQPQAIYAIYRR